MGTEHLIYMSVERLAAWQKNLIFDALRANNRPEVWCIDKDCEDTNWGGAGRLHDRFLTCPPHRPFGGWWR